MILKRNLKNNVNRFLKISGLEISKHGSARTKDMLIAKIITDASNIYRETLLPALPEQNPESIELISELQGTSLGEGFYILNALTETIGVSGDCCEFGVAEGATSALIASAIRNSNKKLWLFDSFEGLPKPTEKDQLKNDIFNLGTMDAYAGTMSTPIEFVKSKLKTINFPFDRTMIVPGFIEETINQTPLPTKVSFAYIDFDFHEPIKIALEFLLNVTTRNSIIIVDDYDYFSTGAKTAVDEFIHSNKDFTFSLPAKSAGHFAILRRK
jgi:O-methyltransferase